jgi:hypothetical protein
VREVPGMTEYPVRGNFPDQTLDTSFHSLRRWCTLGISGCKRSDDRQIKRLASTYLNSE